MISRRRYPGLALAWCCLGMAAEGGQIESFGSFASGGAMTTTGNVQIFDAVEGGIVSAQDSVSYVARNGWLASRILIVAPAGAERQALIVSQPADVTAIPGASARFRVGAVSKAELSYQWRFDGVPIPQATGAVLELSNVSAADVGSYDVVVATDAGTVTSAAARLAVIHRFLRLESVQTTNLTGTVTVPLILAGDGTENSLSCNVSFGSFGLRLDRVVNRSAATMIADTNLPGAVGLNFTLASGVNHPPGTNHLCDLVLRPVGITNQIILNTTFSELPFPVRVLDSGSNSLPVVARSGLVAFRPPLSPTVNPGSGGIGDQVTLVTPDDGTDSSLFVRVLIHDLGVDSLGNPIRVLNAAGTNENGAPFVIFPGSAQPGQTIELAVEYYVSDRVTAPNPRFEIETFADSFIDLPVGLTVVPLSRGLMAAGKFYVDFPTEPNGAYYVQYRDGDAAGNWQTSLPAIAGNGFTRQWIDNGPPVTGTKPAATGARFYRVVKAP